MWLGVEEQRLATEITHRSDVLRESSLSFSQCSLGVLWLNRNWLNYDAAHVVLVGVTGDIVHVTLVAGIGFFGICIPGDIAAREALITKAQQAPIF